MTQNIILALGGLGMLLFGIKMVSTGLQVVAGDRLQVVLKRATSNRFVAAFVGIIATIVINSSTAVSIIAVGFVNAGLMNLTQAIGVLLGVNVGTTFSAQLIAFGIDAYAPVFIFVGVGLYMFAKRSTVRNIGYAVLGFGFLFFSITIIGDALRVFRTHPAFLDMIQAISNPLLALLVGFVITVAIQSSSATMGLLVTMHLSGVPIPFQTSAFIIFGANIGTSVTAVIASIPASRDSKRTALFHIIYDIIGSAVFGTLILFIPGILIWFQNTWAESARQVAMFHTLYNVATLLLLIPFVTLLAKMMQKIIPVIEEETAGSHERALVYLEEKNPRAPTVAVVNAHLEVCRMWRIANENLTLAMEAFFERSGPKAKKVMDNEKTIDYLHQHISDKLAEITNMPLSARDAKRIGDMFVNLSDIEQIGDQAESIAAHAAALSEKSLSFSDSALEELAAVNKLTQGLIHAALRAYEGQSKATVYEIKETEAQIDVLCTLYAKNHFKRLKKKECRPKCGVIFMDVLNDLEKCADNAEKIALSI